MPADNYTFTDALRPTNIGIITWLLVTLVWGFCRSWQGDCAAQRPVRPAQPSGRLRAQPFVPSCTGWTEPVFSPEEWTGSAEWRWTWGRPVYRRTSARARSARCCEVGGRSQPADPGFSSLGQNVSSSHKSVDFWSCMMNMLGLIETPKDQLQPRFLDNVINCFINVVVNNNCYF